MAVWIVPCNVKRFDIFQHFQKNDEVAFKRAGFIQKKDVVFIYLSAPYSEIRFQCTVINDRISSADVKNHKYVIDEKAQNGYILLKLEKTYESGCLPLQKLKENGLGQVQRQAKAKDELVHYIETNGVITAD